MVDGHGQIWLTGAFNAFGSSFVPGIVRLNGDGSIDTQFSPEIRFRDFVSTPLRTGLKEDGAGGIYVLGQYRHEGDPWPYALTHLVGKGLVTVNFDPGPDDVPAGFQWRVNGGPWLDSGEVVLDVPVGDALIEYRPVLGYEALPSEVVQITFGGEVFLNPLVQTVAGTFGAIDQSFNLPEFKRENFPVRVISDGNGGLLVTWG